MKLRETSLDHTDLSGRRTVAALFNDPEMAKLAVTRLCEAGFEKKDIGFVMRRRDGSGGYIETDGTLAGEGLAEGAVAGGVFGGAVGLLAAVGSLIIPGIGPVLVGGILGSMLIGAGIGVIGGGLVGVLIGLGIPESEASEFEHGVKNGGAIVVVNALGRTEEAVRVLRESGGSPGAYDIDEGIRFAAEGKERGDGPVIL
jgi:hypothetical protein